MKTLLGLTKTILRTPTSSQMGMWEFIIVTTWGWMLVVEVNCCFLAHGVFLVLGA
jgi:hypothetical protein